jgi:hypothetical protein
VCLLSGDGSPPPVGVVEDVSQKSKAPVPPPRDLTKTFGTKKSKYGATPYPIERPDGQLVWVTIPA